MSSGRYNSRSFSFLSQQSMQVQDRAGLLWRQVKLMAVWGTQIALYPIYVAFQSSRLAAKQLRHSIGQSLPRLQAAMKRSTQAVEERQPYRSDTPILKTLADVQAMAISLPADQIKLQPALAGDRVQPTSVTASQPGQSPSLRVRGIACAIDSRKLVLATVQNQLLDGFTDSQQEQLQRRMVLELAEYWRQQRLLHLSDAPLVDSFLPLPQGPNAILPIRLFYQLMAWEQRGKIAFAANLFQETRLRGLITASQPPEALPLRSAEVNWQPIGEWSTALGAAMQSTTDRQRRWLQSGTQAFFDRLNRLDNPSAWEITDTSAIERVSKGEMAKWNRTPTAVQPFQPQSKSIAVSIPVQREVVPFTRSETALAPVTASPDEFVARSPQAPGAIEVAPYIEANVQLVGYMKHPLEQVLEWLDRGMVWIEDRIAKFWNWLRRR